MAITLQATVNAYSPSAAHTSGGVTAALISTDESTVDADITAALANATISGDSTALGLVTQIQTDFATLKTDIGTVDLNAAVSGDVVVSYNPSTVVSKNMLRACLNAIMQAVNGAKDLS
jgi:hypothetical protein